MQAGVHTRAPATPKHVVLDAITYNLGYTLDKTTERMRSRYGHSVSRSTIAGWLAEYRALNRRGFRASDLWGAADCL